MCSSTCRAKRNYVLENHCCCSYTTALSIYSENKHEIIGAVCDKKKHHQAASKHTAAPKRINNNSSTLSCGLLGLECLERLIRVGDIICMGVGMGDIICIHTIALVHTRVDNR